MQGFQFPKDAYFLVRIMIQNKPNNEVKMKIKQTKKKPICVREGRKKRRINLFGSQKTQKDL